MEYPAPDQGATPHVRVGAQKDREMFENLNAADLRREAKEREYTSAERIEVLIRAAHRAGRTSVKIEAPEPGAEQVLRLKGFKVDGYRDMAGDIEVSWGQ